MERIELCMGSLVPNNLDRNPNSKEAELGLQIGGVGFDLIRTNALLLRMRLVAGSCAYVMRALVDVGNYQRGKREGRKGKGSIIRGEFGRKDCFYICNF